MARRLIGTAVTDANGEATITYTGTGAGQLNVVAESGTFQSGTYPVWDTIVYDNGSANYDITSNIEMTRIENGTSFVATATGTQYVRLLKGSSEFFLPYDKDWQVELDFYRDNALAFYVSTSSNRLVKDLFSSGSTPTQQWFNMKIKYIASEQKIYRYYDGGTPTVYDNINFGSSNVGINIQDWQGDVNIQIKNLKAYLI